MAETRNPGAGRLDWPGFATFSGALVALVFALIRGNALGWTSPLIVALPRRLGGAAGDLPRRSSAVMPEPMLDLRLFAKPTSSGASVAAFAISASIFALFLYITIYLQSVLGLSALGSGPAAAAARAALVRLRGRRGQGLRALPRPADASPPASG